MSTYTARAVRWEHGWEIHVDGVGVTQSRTLADAERMACDYLATDLGGEPTDYVVVITPDLGGLEVAAEVTRRKTAEATRLQSEAAADARRVARALRDRGLSVADTAAVLHISRGRVSQLVS